MLAGNYRSTPKTENLEMSWTFDIIKPLNLTGDVPPEVAVIHSYATDLMSKGAMALNLHASNSEPDIRPFFYPHFGPLSLGYAPVETSLPAESS